MKVLSSGSLTAILSLIPISAFSFILSGINSWTRKVSPYSCILIAIKKIKKINVFRKHTIVIPFYFCFEFLKKSIGLVAFPYSLISKCR